MKLTRQPVTNRRRTEAYERDVALGQCRAFFGDIQPQGWGPEGRARAVEVTGLALLKKAKAKDVEATMGVYAGYWSRIRPLAQIAFGIVPLSAPALVSGKPHTSPLQPLRDGVPLKDVYDAFNVVRPRQQKPEPQVLELAARAIRAVSYVNADGYRMIFDPRAVLASEDAPLTALVTLWEATNLPVFRDDAYGLPDTVTEALGLLHDALREHLDIEPEPVDTPRPDHAANEKLGALAQQKRDDETPGDVVKRLKEAAAAA